MQCSLAGWLVKSEPGDWSMSDQLAKGIEPWDGVRNAQAQKNMRNMAIGDPVLFYHSGSERRIVGLCDVARAAYPDPADPRYVLVDIKAVRTARSPVPLKAIKADGRFDHLALVRQPRLSVMPIDGEAFARLAGLAGLDEGLATS